METGKIKLSCEHTKCDDMGNNAVWLNQIYFLWLCKKHYEEFNKEFEPELVKKNAR